MARPSASARPGLVRHDEMKKWLHDRKVELRGGDLDEAPQAYRRLPEVLAAHDGTIRVLHALTPIGVAMAGRDIYDPYTGLNRKPDSQSWRVRFHFYYRDSVESYIQEE